MVTVGTPFPIHSPRARRTALAFGFVIAAALGALSALLFAAAAAPASQVATAPAGTRVALYVQTQSWYDSAQPAARRLYLETLLVNTGRGSAAAPAVQDFTVRAADGRTWHVSPATSDVPTSALRPGEQRGLDMFVDLPAPASQLQLVMLYNGQIESVPLLS